MNNFVNRTKKRPLSSIDSASIPQESRNIDNVNDVDSDEVYDVDDVTSEEVFGSNVVRDDIRDGVASKSVHRDGVDDGVDDVNDVDDDVNATLGAQYRTRLTFTLDIVRFLLAQGLPFRGPRESISSNHRGNFKEMHIWCRRIVEVGKVVNENEHKNAQFTSRRIQDDLKTACAAMTRKTIVSDLGDRVFSLLIDETRDSSIKEQMTIIIRYVNDKGAVIERFLGVVHVSDTRARSLKKGVDEFFAQHGLSISKLRGQGYDGVSNMRREINGLNALILEENSAARYIHCFAHELQLVIVAICKDIRPVEEFFNYLSQITNMVGASCKRKDEFGQLQHDKMVEMLQKGEISTGRDLNQECYLAKPDITHWSSYYTTIIRVLSLWSSTIQVLENIYEDGGADSNRGLARDLVEKMESYQFVFIAHLMKKVLSITNILSQFLQRKDQDILEVVRLVRSCKKQFQNLRNDGWDELLEDVNAFCDNNEVDILNMDDNVQGRFDARRVGNVSTNYHHFRVDIFCRVIDQIDQEMENRFGESNTELLACIGCLDPRDSFSKFSRPQLLRLAQFYPQDFSVGDLLLLKDQLRTWIYYMREGDKYSRLQSIGEVAMKMVEGGIDTVFPLVFRLLELILVLPVVTTTVERAFSAMKIVKSELRNKMSDDNLPDSLVCYIEKDIFMNVDNEDILQYYQNMSNRKMGLHPLFSD